MSLSIVGVCRGRKSPLQRNETAKLFIESLRTTAEQRMTHRLEGDDENSLIDALELDNGAVGDIPARAELSFCCVACKRKPVQQCILATVKQRKTADNTSIEWSKYWYVYM